MAGTVVDRFVEFGQVVGAWRGAHQGRRSIHSPRNDVLAGRLNEDHLRMAARPSELETRRGIASVLCGTWMQMFSLPPNSIAP